MTAPPAELQHYNDAWNERDLGKIRGHLERAVAPDVLFIDPAHTTRDIDALEAMIVDARNERPDADYLVTSGVDGHNRRYRYLWAVEIGGQRVLPGMDVTTVDEQGRIVQIDGFFGDFPERTE